LVGEFRQLAHHGLGATHYGVELLTRDAANRLRGFGFGLEIDDVSHPAKSRTRLIIAEMKETQAKMDALSKRRRQ
jgi:hypothetical protein